MRILRTLRFGIPVVLVTLMGVVVGIFIDCLTWLEKKLETLAVNLKREWKP